MRCYFIVTSREIFLKSPPQKEFNNLISPTSKVRSRFANTLIPPSRFYANICRSSYCYFQKLNSKEITHPENRNSSLLLFYCIHFARLNYTEIVFFAFINSIIIYVRRNLYHKFGNSFILNKTDLNL